MGLFSKIFSKKETRPEVKERTPLSIEIGDIVEYDLSDYEVVGKITYRQGSYEWISYQLIEGNNTIWLAAEMDDELELGIYKTIHLPVTEKYPKKLSYEGKDYYLDEEGEARVVGEGRSKNINGRMMEYAEYCDEEEEHFISLEHWGSEIEASYGYPIEAFELKIIAGSN
ncbi:DUF4178 domain-containing protein [Aquibacillus koreensis]|uniref:DUF4178 domain-containing protein n=1 Tax=Aquibacillus koreensis TaxID=279446 RepID=A0A9X3WLE1_9BACI|nr:DUF4178 domain-containing protein [Aquibacillus koreensis]MCT2534979.1 DUF4178 domain-containing protein [Aquibacillus koreensis]MDC3419266.1 DUF4178 domain-containing protein [Aquibacillus koreensis]